MHLHVALPANQSPMHAKQNRTNDTAFHSGMLLDANNTDNTTTTTIIIINNKKNSNANIFYYV